MFDNNSESTVFDMFPAAKILYSQDFYKMWKNPYEENNKEIPSVKTLDYVGPTDFAKLYKNSLKSTPLTEDEFCNIMTKDSSTNNKVDKEQPYTTIFGPNKKQITEDIEQPPVTSITPEDVLFDQIETDTFKINTDIKLKVCENKPNGIFKLNGFSCKPIEFDDQSNILYEYPKDIEDVVKTFNKKDNDEMMDIFHNLFNTDTNTSKAYEYFTPYTPHHYQFIDPFHSKEELIDYMMNHIDKFDNDTLDHLAYHIAKEKIRRIDNGNTKK